jgi:hypothetical protein
MNILREPVQRACSGRWIAIMVLWGVFAFLTRAVPATETISSLQAAEHVGKTVTVCGPVAGASFFEHLRGAPTFINFDRRHPDQSFTVVIWGRDNRKFERPPHRMYGAGKEICVTGRIETYQGRPQIVVRDPAQITVVVPVFDGERFSREGRILLKALLAELDLDTDPGDGKWDSAADEALQDFQARAGLADEKERSPRTLRALAAAVDDLDGEARGRILKLVLLNMAQREEVASRGIDDLR